MQMTALAGASVKGTNSSEQDRGNTSSVCLLFYKSNLIITHVYGLVVHPSVYIIIYST